LQNPTTIPSVRFSHEQEERERERERERKKEREKCHLLWPPLFLPAAKGITRTPLGQNLHVLQHERSDVFTC
jgi:hypothetical protein